MEEEIDPAVQESARKETILRTHAQELLKERFNVDWFEICEALQRFSQKTWPIGKTPWALCKSIAEEETAGRKAAILVRDKNLGELDEHTKGLESFAKTGELSGPPDPLSEPFADDEETEPIAVAPIRWPREMRREAFDGIVGEIVERVMPHTEGDENGILLSFLIGYGNILGKGLHYHIGSVEHPPRLYGILIGSSATGRKGTSTSDATSLLRLIDEDWRKNCLYESGGLSSGEGLIENVRDDWIEIKKNGDPKFFKGVSDKRMFLIENEFSRVTAAKGREGSTLGAIIRGAWDHEGTLALLNRKKIRASWSMISILAHCTFVELKELVTKTDIFSGFLNRFLWFCTKTSKLIAIPERGWDPGWIESGIVRRLQDAARAAGALGRVELDEDAARVWIENYPRLRSSLEGTAWVIMARSAPIALRLALIYMALDGEKIIRARHLESALAVVDYSRDSVKHIFGESTGNFIADKILELLRECGPNGASRSEIRAVLSSRSSRVEIDQAIALLVETLLIDGPYREVSEKGGRPKEIWKLKR